MELVYKNYFDKFDIYLNENLQLCVGMVMPTTTGVKEVQLFCRTVNSVAISKLSHLAIVLNDGNLSIYIDGINQKLEGSNTNISGVLGAASRLRIGAAGGSTDLIWYTDSSEVIILDIQNVLSFTSLGAVDRYNFPVTITANNVPAGFAFDSSTGYVQNLLFRGVNTPFTTNNFTVTATDAFGSLTSRSYYLKVIPAVFIFTNSVTLTYSYSQNYANISSPGKISYNPSSNSFGINRYDINNSDQFFSLVTNIGTRACYFSIEHANGSMLLKTGLDSTGYGYLTPSNSIVISGNAITYSGPAPIFTSNIPAENETVKLRISPVDTSPVTFSSAGSNFSSVVTTNLLVHLDAGDTNSYSGSGSIWRDLSGNNNNFNIVPGAYNSFGVKYMNFGGGFGIAKNASDISLTDATGVTYVIWCRVLNSNTNARTLTRAYGGDHHVFISSGAWDIGAYDNDTASFYGTGYSQQSLPNYGTSNWIAMYWRWQATSPYYELSFNDTPGFIRGSITNVNARYNRGFGSIGGYHNESTDPSNASQFWGDIAVFMAYNRRLTNDELLQNFRYYNSRFNISGTSGDPVISSSNIVYNVVTNSYYEGRNLFWDTFAGETSTLNFANGVNSGTLTISKGNAAITLSTVPDTGPDSKALIFGVRESLGGPLVGINNALINNFILNVLIAGGGAGGQYDGGGGGGAGGLVILNLTGVLGASYDISIGAGGGAGGNGTNSVFGPYTALGGGTGGRTQGQSGGSGGGGNMFYSYSFCTGGPGIQNSAMGYGLGNSGGNGNTDNTQSYGYGGGGGGSGGIGAAATNSQSGMGGPATASTITGSTVFYCGGGGGGALNGASNVGGGGGAGNGAAGGNNVGGGASSNTGSGGGGGGGNSAAGGPGGSGVVILAYPTNYGNLAAISAGLTFAYDATTRSGYRVYRFTGGTGTITFPGAIVVQPLPGAPMIGTATATGSSTATVSYTAPDNNGGSVITSYTAVSTPGGLTGTVNQAGSGVITVTGLSPSSSYTFRVFATNANGSSLNSAPSNQITTPGTAPATLDYVVVAGGGGGGGSAGWEGGGGGGAGGVLSGTITLSTTAASLTISVGGGGSATQDAGSSGSGLNSSLVFTSGTGSPSSIISTGGGGGGRGPGGDNGATGGSGGGGTGNAGFRPGGSGTSGQGNNGGGGGHGASGGGGGGKNAVGGDSGGAGGAGGTFLGLTVGGGGGGGYGQPNGGGAGNPGAAGGTGGGGTGGGATNTAGSGGVNTGGGGGGARNGGTGTTFSGSGGSGVVRIQHSSATPQAASTTGNPTITVGGGVVVYTFNGSGSITWI